MSNRTTMREKWRTCWACGVDIYAELTVEVGPTQMPDQIAHEGDVIIDMQGKVLGLMVQHDCRPKVTRGEMVEKMFPGAATLADMTQPGPQTRS
jgi:hypothetical protein